MTSPKHRRLPSASSKHTRNVGLSIVELLVGIAVGLFILAGATMMASNQISDNKRLLLETQVQQDMRTAMDVIVRDIRRSGFSAKADELQPVGVPLATPIEYQPAGAMSNSNPLLYTYSNDTVRTSDNRTANAGDPDDHPDFKGFRLQGGVIQVQLGLNNWQALTDPNVVEITNFTAVIPNPQTASIPTCNTPSACPSLTGCAANAQITTRYIELVMRGRAAHDPRIERQLEAKVRVRNDEVCL